MELLEHNFRDILISLLKELAADSKIFAINAGEQAYYIEGVIKELEAKTNVGEQFAKAILGTAVEMVLRNKEHINYIKEAELSADKFLKRYASIRLPDML